jgi:hypothetical protein
MNAVYRTAGIPDALESISGFVRDIVQRIGHDACVTVSQEYALILSRFLINR